MEFRHKKSASVVIYKGLNRGVTVYTAAFNADGRRQRLMRRSFDDAFDLAKGVVIKMAAGALNVLTLDGRQRFVYERAIELAATTGLELDTLVDRAVKAATIIGGFDHLPEAARLFEAQHRGVVSKTVAEVVTELIENRQASNASELYLRDLRLRLKKRFANAFQVPISSVTTGDIQLFIDGLKGKPRTKKNFLTTIGTLLAFAKRKGYLPEVHPGISKVDFKANITAHIEIFSPDEMEKLLSNARPELVPVLAMGAFAGLRSEELKRLQWASVNFKEKHIVVGSEIAKGRKRRIVDMTDNLYRWLLPYRKPTGPVFKFNNLALQFGKLAKVASVSWRRNGLRHSFISHRVAITENLEKVALEAGNSVTVIRSSYLKMVTRKQGRCWFSIKPPPMRKPTRGRR